MVPLSFCLFFFFNDTATTEIYTLSLHDALPISWLVRRHRVERARRERRARVHRSEEHTSELQSRVDISYAVFCLKKKNTIHSATNPRPPFGHSSTATRTLWV